MSDVKTPLLNKNTIIAGFIFAVFLCLITFFIQIALSQTIKDFPNHTYQLVITPVNQEVMREEEDGAIIINPQETDLPFIEGVIGVGMQVIVRGTEDKGLRMRQGAGFSSPILFLASEGEILQIIEGPIIEDGVIWWKLVSTEDPLKSGWSVQDYLSIE